MEKTIIDMKKNLTFDSISKFVTNHSEFFIQCNEQNHFIQKTDLHEMFSKLSSNSLLTDDDEVSMFTNEEELVFTIWDVRWWTKTSKRLDKIKSLYNNSSVTNTSKKKITFEPQTYTCGCATLKEGEISDVVICEGTKSQIITFMNEQLQKRAIDSFLQSQPVFNLAYTKDDEYDVEHWLTLDELVEIGAIELS